MITRVTYKAHDCPVIQDVLLLWKTFDEYVGKKRRRVKVYCYHCDKLIR